MKFLDIDSPLMQGLSKVADLMILNLLTIVCCLPVITVGPALTALNYMALKMVRNEEGYIARAFFKSFKENLRQGIMIWLLFLLAALVLVFDYFIMGSTETQMAGIGQILVGVAAIFVISTALYAFPLLAKFKNSIGTTLKNALLVSMMQFPKTVLMFVMYLIPMLIFIYFFEMIPFVLFFGLSVPAWVSAKLYNKFFQKLEDKYWESQGGKPTAEEKNEGEEDVRIFRDELDSTLQDKTLE